MSNGRVIKKDVRIAILESGALVEYDLSSNPKNKYQPNPNDYEFIGSGKYHTINGVVPTGIYYQNIQMHFFKRKINNSLIL